LLSEGILKKFRTDEVALPLMKTVAMIMMQVVVKNTCLTSDKVFWIEMVKAMAPRIPVNHITC